MRHEGIADYFDETLPKGKRLTRDTTIRLIACYFSDGLLPKPPTGLVLSIESGNGDDDLDLAFTLSTDNANYDNYKFELYSSTSQDETYSLVTGATQNATSSPPAAANFDNQTTGRWYKVRGRNCKTSSRLTCGAWIWSNVIHLPTPTPPPTVRPTPPPTATPTPTATPEPTPTPVVKKPTGVKSRPHSTGKVVLGKNDAQLVLYWDPIPGVMYEVEWKKGSILPFRDKWIRLPSQDHGFTLNGFTTGDVDITDSQVLIGGLEFDKSYSYRVRSVSGNQQSGWSETHKTRTPIYYIGHQADHTVQYEIGTPAPTPISGSPSSVHDPRVAIPTALTYAVNAWNGSGAATAKPFVLFCETGKCGNRIDDGRTVLINVLNGGCPLVACVKSRDGSDTNYADSDGHMNNLEIVIEEPAFIYYVSGGLEYRLRLVWTNDPDLHQENVPGVHGLYEYLPQVFMHELGHALGLHDLYLFGEYAGYLMDRAPERGVYTSVPAKDIKYLSEVYRNHEAHVMPAP